MGLLPLPPLFGNFYNEITVISLLVGMTGFEPATTRPPDAYSTGLSYIPKILIISHLDCKKGLTFETSKSCFLPIFTHYKTRPPDVYSTGLSYIP